MDLITMQHDLGAPCCKVITLNLDGSNQDQYFAYADWVESWSFDGQLNRDFSSIKDDYFNFLEILKSNNPAYDSPSDYNLVPQALNTIPSCN